MAISLFKKSGFTLIELLVVISIIATLTAILLPNFMGARQRATDSQKKQEMVSIKNALRLFYNDTQNYPPTGANLGTTLAPYMPSVSGIGFSYTYASTNNGDAFQLCSVMDASGDDVIASQKNCLDPVTSTVCGTGLTANLSLYVVCTN